MTDPIEKLIQSIPLKNPSATCDARIQDVLSQVSDLPASKSDQVTMRNKRSWWMNPLPMFSTAAALLIGFLLGAWVNQPVDRSNGNPDNGALSSQVAGFELTDDVQVIEGGSKTVIVSDSILVQDEVPVRKLETVTRKRVRVKPSDQDVEKELEVPIRKVFYTLAETI